MLASDLGYLTVGGILGVLAGAALLAVLRARPPAPRRVRLTMTLGSVPIRPSATTLAFDPFAPEAPHVARRGPADMDWQADRLALSHVAGEPGPDGTPVRSGPPHEAGAEPPSPAQVTVETEPARPVGRVTEAAAEARVGVPVDDGADPVLAAIQAVRPAAPPQAGGALAIPPAQPGSGYRPGRAGIDADGVGVPVLVDRPGTPVGLHESDAGSGVAMLEAALRARRGIASSTEVGGSVATLARPDPRSVASASGAGDATGAPGDGPASTASGAGGGGQPAASTPEADPCSEARHTVDERCALAERMRLTAERAADALREAQRTFDVHVAHAEAAAAIAESRAQRAAKDEAQNTFRTERARAGSREAVEQAARDWLQEINRINAASREAAASLVREREAAAALQPTIERLTVEADAARVQAEGAAESCLIARETLAACEEAVVHARSAHAGDEGHPAEPTPPGSGPSVPTSAGGGSGGPGGTTEPEEEGALAAAIHAGEHPAILRLLTGDRAVMQRLVTELAEDDPADRRRWQIQLADLVDAVVSRAIEACAFVFPDDHPFWAPFNRTQGRDIALALSSLGFRFDGMGGFADDRSPTQRDVSLALGYAGLDPMRVRRWPTEAELGELYRDVTVAADEYILGAASGLTLGELVGILGRRADGLTEVWNAWGRIRPILLEDMGGPPESA